MTAGKELNTVL